MISLFIIGPLLLGAGHHHPKKPLPAPNSIPQMAEVKPEPKACGSAPAGMVPGWRFEEYERTATPGGLMTSRPIGVGATFLPTTFATKTNAPRSSMLRAAYVRGHMTVCEDGVYSVALMIEAPVDGVLCTGFLDFDRQRSVEISDMNIAREDLVRQFTGKDVQLSKGVAEVGLWLNCAQRKFSGFRSATVTYDAITAGWLATAFTIKIRGPGDDGLRDFRQNEVYRPK